MLYMSVYVLHINSRVPSLLCFVCRKKLQEAVFYYIIHAVVLGGILADRANQMANDCKET